MKLYAKLTAAVMLMVALAAPGLRASTLAEGSKLVTECGARLGSAPSMTAMFIIHGHAGQIPGTLTMSGKCFKLVTDGFAIWYDGKTQWTYIPENNEINISEPTDEELAETNPVEIISSSLQHYKVTGTVARGKHTVVTLAPKVSGGTIVSAEVVIDPATKLPTRIVVGFSNGGRLEAGISGIKFGKALPRSEFVYNTATHPTAETVDLR